MGTMIVKALICILIPIIMLSGLLEKNSRRIAIALAAGCCMCLIAYYYNNFIYSLLNVSYFYLTTTITPIDEEILKFVPILIFFLAFPSERRQVVSFSFAVGIGFAIIENSYMLLQASESSTISWLLLRGIGTGLMHGMSTAIEGYGLYAAYKDKRLHFVGTLSALLLAMMYHGTYNCLIQTESVRFIGILLPALTYAAMFVAFYKENRDCINSEKNSYKKQR